MPVCASVCVCVLSQGFVHTSVFLCFMVVCEHAFVSACLHICLLCVFPCLCVRVFGVGEAPLFRTCLTCLAISPAILWVIVA